MILEKEQWRRFIKGFDFIGGLIGFENNRYCFILEEKKRNVHRDPPPCIRILYARMERPLEQRLYRLDYPELEYPMSAYVTTNGVHEFITGNMQGGLVSYRYLDDGIVLDDEDEDTPGIVTQWAELRKAPVKRLRRVQGKLYAVCADRRILERRGVGQWTELPGLERPKERMENTHYPALSFGFDDMDAFDPDDIYAIGGKGDVWHYNGSSWRQCHFPSQKLIETVCCGGDGKVYIGGGGGVNGGIWIGRDDQWEQVPGTEYANPDDIVWFAGKAWASAIGQLSVITPDGMTVALTPDYVQATTGHISVSEDGTKMLAAGNRGASVFDGQEWQLLIDTFLLSEGEEDDDDDDE